MRMLWCSDFIGLPTGYSQVTKNILGRLRRGGIEALTYSFQCITMQHATQSPTFELPVYFCPDMSERYGNKLSVINYASQLKPDITAFLCDSFMIKWLTEKSAVNEKFVKNSERLKEHTKKLLFYFPFDSDTVYEGAREVMEEMDIRIAMSKWGQKVLKRDTGLQSFYIPHGVDTNVYRPLNDTSIENLKKQNKIDGKFVIGCVAKNQTRKILTNLYKAFEIFHKNHPDSVLFMHCDPKDPQGWNLADLGKRYGIDKDIVYGLQRYDKGLPEIQVNAIYNIMDVHTLPTSGEGWGLPITESMAAGTLNLVTDYTTTEEILGDDRGLKIERAKFSDGTNADIVGQLNTNRAYPDVDDLVKKLEWVYNNPEKAKKMAEVGRKYVIKNLDWNKVVRAWQELFEFGEIYEYNQVCEVRD